MSITTIITLALVLKRFALGQDIKENKTETEETCARTSEETPSLIEDDRSDHAEDIASPTPEDPNEMISSLEPPEPSTGWQTVKRLSKRVSAVWSQLSIKYMPTTSLEEEDDDDDSDDREPTVVVRDYAYASDSPLFHGPQNVRRDSEITLTDEEVKGRTAMAMHDFVPETDTEIAMKKGDQVHVQCRLDQGWLFAAVRDQTGLVPESYVSFI